MGGERVKGPTRRETGEEREREPERVMRGVRAWAGSRHATRGSPSWGAVPTRAHMSV